MNALAFPRRHRRRARLVAAFAAAFLLLALAGAGATITAAVSASRVQNAVANNAPPRTPSEVVREFYKALREKRFRDAFAMSIYQPGVEKLSAEEFEELRPDFERIAAGADKVEISGEQISGDTATVFVKTGDGGDNAAPTEPVPLLRAGNAWIIGDKTNQAIIKDRGSKFFLESRIETHHSEVQSMLQRIAAAQLVYTAQHNGQAGTLDALVRAGLVPQDVLATESTGYRFYVTPGKDGKSFTAGATPDRYGRTGRLSFFMDASGIKSKDNGGKPLK